MYLATCHRDVEKYYSNPHATRQVFETNTMLYPALNFNQQLWPQRLCVKNLLLENIRQEYQESIHSRFLV